MSDNPFIDEQPPEYNPFMDLDEPDDEDDEVGEELMTTKGRPRARRPDGSLYSTDPSERANQLVADGKFGGGVVGTGAARRRKRAAQVVAEMAARESEKIKKVFTDGIQEGNPISVRIQAAKEILKVEGDEAALEQREREREYGRMTKGELVDDIIAGLAALHKAGSISDDVISLSEADVVDVTDESDSAAA